MKRTSFLISYLLLSIILFVASILSLSYLDAGTQLTPPEVINIPVEHPTTRFKVGQMENTIIYTYTLQPIENQRITSYTDSLIDYEYQEYVFTVCENSVIDPYTVIALIERESMGKVDALGDSGNSYGLMQIQPKWWAELIEEYKIDNLLNAYQNITLGVAILEYYQSINPDPYWYLMAYNGGMNYANNNYNNDNISDYATSIYNRANELRNINLNLS